jgi:hypothetical protein
MEHASRHRWRRALATLFGATLVVGSAHVAIAATAADGGVVAHSCAPSHLAISFGTTGLDASHVNAFLVFTNTASTTCTLDGYPTVHYVTKGGSTVGNPSQPATAAHAAVTLAKGGSAHALLRASVPGVWPPTQCVAKTAWGIRVLAPGATHGRVLHFPGSVCSGATIHEATTAPLSAGRGPVPARCDATQLLATLGMPNGTAGTTYVPVVFTDPRFYTCSVAGHPAVTSVTGAAHTQVGPPANDDPGTAVVIWVQPFGGKASADLGIVDTGAISPSACVAKHASGLKVVAPSTSRATVLHYPHEVCTHQSSTHVSVVLSGSLG